MYAKTIRSVSFPFAWQKAVEFVEKSKEVLTFGGGKEVKHAVDSQCTIILDKNAVQDVLNHVVHPSDPFATPLKLKQYIDEYSDSFNASKFDYTYYDILKRGFNKYFIDEKYNTGDPEEKIIGKSDNGLYYLKTAFNQIESLRSGLQKQVDENLSSNRNVAVMWNPVVHTYSTKGIPCWNEVLVRYIPSDHPGIRGVKIYTHFRSHDLATAWEGNMVAIIDFINREVVKPCGCEIVEIIESNFSLHIYDYDLPSMKNIKKLSVNPALQKLQDKYDRIDSPSIFDEFLESKEL